MMIAALSLLLLSAEGTSNPDWNCDDPMAQQEINWCAHQEYLAADAALNTQWKQTVAVMRDRDTRRAESLGDRRGHHATLLAAQRAWIDFRDAQCTSEGYYAAGGSLEPLLVSLCKTRETKRRTQQLQFLIEQ